MPRCWIQWLLLPLLQLGRTLWSQERCLYTQAPLGKRKAKLRYRSKTKASTAELAAKVVSANALSTSSPRPPLPLLRRRLAMVTLAVPLSMLNVELDFAAAVATSAVLGPITVVLPTGVSRNGAFALARGWCRWFLQHQQRLQHNGSREKKHWKRTLMVMGGGL